MEDNIEELRRGKGRGQQQEKDQDTNSNIESRPFCTHQCLLGLLYGDPIDENCPNSDHHGQMHITGLEFLRLVRNQLAIDRGRDADCAPLSRYGARGTLFKVRLSSHGYTLVAKGMEAPNRVHLQHEAAIYDRLWTIQGRYVPVCLGNIDLVLPYYYNGSVNMHFMFLSWAGRPLFECVDKVNMAGVVDKVTTIYRAVHRLSVLHRDAEPRNILYDTISDNVMLVDFERAELLDRQSLGSSRRGGLSQKQGEDDFVKELEHAVGKVSKFAARRTSSRAAFPSL